MVNLGGLAQAINHPGVPWGVGGTIGGVIGTVAMQPSCHTTYDRVTFASKNVCDPATLPLIGEVDQLSGVAILTVVGALIGYLVKRANQ